MAPALLELFLSHGWLPPSRHWVGQRPSCTAMQTTPPSMQPHRPTQQPFYGHHQPSLSGDWSQDADSQVHQHGHSLPAAPCRPGRRHRHYIQCSRVSHHTPGHPAQHRPRRRGPHTLHNCPTAPRQVHRQTGQGTTVEHLRDLLRSGAAQPAQQQEMALLLEAMPAAWAAHICGSSPQPIHPPQRTQRTDASSAQGPMDASRTHTQPPALQRCWRRSSRFSLCRARTYQHFSGRCWSSSGTPPGLGIPGTQSTSTRSQDRQFHVVQVGSQVSACSFAVI